MKRRDWKIKKLKKDIYGKIFKRRRLFFLRELFLRRCNNFFKKDLLPNYYLYRQFYQNFEKKYLYINNINFNNSNINFYFFFPKFFFKKKIFNYFIFFKDLSLSNKLDYIFIKKKYDFKNVLPKSNNIAMFDKKNSLIDLNFLKNEDNDKLLAFKYINNYYFTNKELSFFLNYNVYILNLNEIYKIMIIIYIFKLLNYK